MLFKKLLELHLNKIDHVVICEHIEFVHVDDDVANSDLLAEEDVLLGLRHGTVNRGDHQDTRVHLGSSSDHVLDIIDVPRAVDVREVAGVGFVLYGCGVDGDTSGFLLRGLVDGGILVVFRFVLLAEIFGDGGGEGGFAVVDVTNGADWVGRGVPLQWVLDRSNLAKG